jgi:hypothetical protein
LLIHIHHLHKSQKAKWVDTLFVSSSGY